jgi:fatty acid desaturase
MSNLKLLPSKLMSVSQKNPREKMSSCPQRCQRFLTLATGKPLKGETPSRLTPMYHLGTATLSLLSGVILNILFLHHGFFVCLPLGWLFTVSGARKLQVQIVHQCAHEQFLGREKFDQWLGEALSILLMINNFPTYCQEHKKEHHGLKNLMTPTDPTFQFLQTLGLLNIEP